MSHPACPTPHRSPYPSVDWNRALASLCSRFPPLEVERYFEEANERSSEGESYQIGGKRKQMLTSKHCTWITEVFIKHLLSDSRGARQEKEAEVGD